MGYYILVEKDSKVMHKYWKWSIVVLLDIIIVTCVLSSFAFSAFAANFNNNCPTGEVDFTFKDVHVGLPAVDAQLHQQKVDELYKEFQTLYTPKELREIDETGAVPKTQIYQFFNNGASVARTTTERSNFSYSVPEVSAEELYFFKNNEIDEFRTKWGKSNTCLIYVYFPIVEITAAVVWIVFIFISRQDRNRRIECIHKAWRFVVPAVVCFAVLAICCVIYAAYLNSQLNYFCKELKQHFANDDISCKLLLNRYALKTTTTFDVATNFHLAKYVAYVRIFLWLLAGFIMLLRCILRADFDMHEIEYSAEQMGMAFDPRDHPSRVKFIDDGIKRHSHERVYKPTTTELQTIE